MGSTAISMDAFMEGCLALYVVFSTLFVAALFVSARRQRRRASETCHRHISAHNSHPECFTNSGSAIKEERSARAASVFVRNIL